MKTEIKAWAMVGKIGSVNLYYSLDIAEKNKKNFDRYYPEMGPHSIVELTGTFDPPEPKVEVTRSQVNTAVIDSLLGIVDNLENRGIIVEQVCKELGL